MAGKPLPQRERRPASTPPAAPGNTSQRRLARLPPLSSHPPSPLASDGRAPPRRLGTAPGAFHSRGRGTQDPGVAAVPVAGRPIGASVQGCSTRRAPSTRPRPGGGGSARRPEERRGSLALARRSCPKGGCGTPPEATAAGSVSPHPSPPRRGSAPFEGVAGRGRHAPRG